MKPFIITRERLAQILGDGRVFEMLPELAELQPTYATCYQASCSHKGCCGSGIVHMFPVLRQALLLIGELKNSADFVERFRNLMELRTGRRIPYFLIHYRETVRGKPQRIAIR